MTAIPLDVEGIEMTISYTFTIKAILTEALTTLYRNELEEGGIETRQGNKRLSYVGEAALRLCITQEWYRGTGSTCKLHCRT